MSKLLIKNARLVNEGATIETDVLVDGERIEKIAADISGKDADVLDAEGKFLIARND